MSSPAADLCAAALRGLTAAQRTLPSKYLYDERGAALFDRICDLDEYYLMRAELRILRRYLPEIRDRIGPRARIIEPGSGTGAKTRLLLHALDEPAEYVPIDISTKQLAAWSRAIAREFPELIVHPLSTDYTTDVMLPSPSAGVRRTVAFFPGSTIGNFEPPEARTFVRALARQCGSDGALLIGVDLKKSRQRLEAAYDDARGVTAEFNLNLLRRMNEECGADFDLATFQHRAVYDEDRGRIEMHLVSRLPQTAHIPDHRGVLREIRFETGDVIVTEHSYKYSVKEFRELAADADCVVTATWLDDEHLFSVHWLEPVS